jgi:hypothetical protein
MNPFVKFRGLEVFGVVERAEGKASTELTERIWKQYAVDTVYRFLPNETLFVGARYNKAHGELAGITGDVGADRSAYHHRIRVKHETDELRRPRPPELSHDWPCDAPKQRLQSQHQPSHLI